jgi:hypothetical protein
VGGQKIRVQHVREVLRDPERPPRHR